jgi:hypothetical protein
LTDEHCLWLTTLVVVATPGTGAVYSIAAGLSRAPRAGIVAGVLQEPEQEDSKSNSSRTPGPKPESMMVPGGARRSDQQAHPSRLG